MLTPEYLDSLPDEVVKLLDELEMWVIEELSARIADGMIGAEETDILRNISYYLDTTEITNRIADKLEYSRKEADRLFDEVMDKVGRDASKFDSSALDPAYRIMEYYRQAMQSDLSTITTAVGFAEEVGGKVTFVPMSNFYRDSLNMARMQVQMGLLDYDTATQRVVDTMARSGIRYMDYSGGITRRIDNAVRTAILTGVNQAAGAANEYLANELNLDLMEITAHYGARPSHAEWQGEIVSLSGQPGYLTVDDVGYGTVTGLLGANCRHNWFPYLEGSERAYSKSELDRYKNDTVTFEGKEYTAYEATQLQRKYERNIRYTKEKIAGYHAAGLDDAATEQSVRLRRMTDGYKNLCKQTGLKPRESALRVSPELGYNKNVASKAVASAKAKTKATMEAAARDLQRREYLKNIKPTLPKYNVTLPDTVLQQTLSIDVMTKGKYELHSVAPKGAELTSVRIIAGYGTSSNFRLAKGFSETYGGEDYKWQKVGGIIKTDNFAYDIHWYQLNGDPKHYVYELVGVKENTK